MKITKKENHLIDYFDDISVGTVFLFENTCYMRTERFYDEHRNLIANAIILANGYSAYFDSYDEVTPLDKVELIIG